MPPMNKKCKSRSRLAVALLKEKEVKFSKCLKGQPTVSENLSILTTASR